MIIVCSSRTGVDSRKEEEGERGKGVYFRDRVAIISSSGPQFSL
jgi:hypothetical protein